MRYLSLFSGVGGFDLACQHFLGWRCVGYNEWDRWCCHRLDTSIAEGWLDPAPILAGDLREFVTDGSLAGARGVDAVVGGFPCQPFSQAGNQRGADDPRNMWPATRDTIALVRPRYAYLENVPGLASGGYLSRVLGDLAELGMHARWGVLSAAEVGAWHQRKRLWIWAVSDAVPDSHSDALQIERERGGKQRREQGPAQPRGDGAQDVPDATRIRGRRPRDRAVDGRASRRGVDRLGTQHQTDVSVAQRSGLEGLGADTGQPQVTQSGNGGASALSDTHGRRREQLRQPQHGVIEGPRGNELAGLRTWGRWPGPDWFAEDPAESVLGRVVDGVADRTDWKHRLRALGNGVVPQQAAAGWGLLNR